MFKNSNDRVREIIEIFGRDDLTFEKAIEELEGVIEWMKAGALKSRVSNLKQPTKE